MKRSEAILEISCNLWGKNIPTNSKELAELVVTLSEELGMLPPPTTRTAKITSEKLNGFRWEDEN